MKGALSTKRKLKNRPKAAAQKQSLFDFFQNSPFYGVELELPPRYPDPMREIDL